MRCKSSRSCNAKVTRSSSSARATNRCRCAPSHRCAKESPSTGGLSLASPTPTARNVPTG
ncbi:hypothetical protein FJK96_10435 [Mycobacteroides chelonae]|uniref:Uncharacterized protein n=1 Tax=Mycobacteroides chelonae TaxID=1774 RepID=A0AB73U0X5_MYCCH|nr:hypothetical protein FJK96_10435 [Mycobacteroides chelonae]